MKLLFLVEIEVAKDGGKYVSRDDVVEVLLDELNNANPSELSFEESNYDVVEWDVAEVTPQELIKRQNQLTLDLGEPKS